jgi:Protein of unknown function (DUF3306)
MADSPSNPEGFSLKRWSRRKLEAAQAAAPAGVPASAVPVRAAAVVAAPAPVVPDPPAAREAPVLPPVESLTHDSDFSAFMQPKVDEAIKRAALKKLFTDPRFNVMDGLDIYVGDYTQADPMPAGMLEKLGKVYEAVTESVVKVDAPSPSSMAAAAEIDPASPPTPSNVATEVPATPAVASDMPASKVPPSDVPPTTPTNVAASRAGDTPDSEAEPAPLASVPGAAPTFAPAAQPAAKPQ